MFVRLNQGHLASALSQVELVVDLYYGGALSYRRGEPDHPGNDRVLISKGHAAMGIYPVLADIGFFDAGELVKCGTPGALLQIFPKIGMPGIGVTGASLAHGPGIGAGHALAAKRDGTAQRIHVMVSDGEHYEGSLWETALFAAHHELDNMCLMVDRNRKIILGDSEDLLRLEPLADKYASFGWHAMTVDGHDHGQILGAYAEAKKTKGKPSVIIAETIKGKGISFMEGDHRWHHGAFNQDQVTQARAELAARAPVA